MNCKLAQNKLWELIDGTGSSKLINELNAHLNSCSDCTLALSEMKQVVSAVKSIPAYQASHDFSDAVHARIAAKSAAALSRWASFTSIFVWKPFALTAATGAIAAVLVCAYVMNVSVQQPETINPPAVTTFTQAATSEHNDFLSTSGSVLDQADDSDSSAVDVGAM